MYQEKLVDPAWIIDSSCLHNPDQHACLQFSRDVEVTIWPSANPYPQRLKKKNICSAFLTAAQFMTMWHYANVLSDKSGIFFCGLKKKIKELSHLPKYKSLTFVTYYLTRDKINRFIGQRKVTDLLHPANSYRWTEFGV